MARPRKAKPPPPPPRAAAPSIAEALLMATICMVGLPVEVRVRDGSTYSGVLHTACVDAGYGVVLKKAKKIANGKGDANLSLGSFVDTLVVHPDDLVQVIAKGLSLPVKGVCKPLDSNVVASNGSLKRQNSHANDPKMSKPENISPLMQTEKCTSVGQGKNTSVKKNGQNSGSATSLSSSTGLMGPCFSMNEVSGSATMVPKVDAATSSAIAAPLEFKLNPCARVFSPSFASSRQVLAAMAPVDTYYISHSAPEVPMGVPVYESKSVPGVSPLTNKVHCSNLSPANYAISPQYVQSIVGHNTSRLDPARVGTPYHPMQVGATYTTPSPQPAMTGKFSPVVYVHPVPQDPLHGTPSGFQGWPRPVLLNSYQASMQKFQGNTPVYLAPPIMATGNLPLVVPSPAPLVQPFQAIHPIMVPAASSVVPGKYM
ncbi:hypothetical protein Zm00014a_027070 [Zea mays]|uniref:Ataxin 2 SM domain-containing protein n=2 Tax=Zea mays TaxID=4577 RepID=A0A3L6G1X4_MAIZE|nr:Polyadenylate-binding protein-interacting protein 4 [Zea mays]PWZ39410.1 hypothetical protein Zm00014a_027070 [Zea mays]